ncbi:hypothetical protein FB45DRAFT_1078883 [Roridomyces roridus]|uniref:Uncharacterized protein n=1 Tax=Roridomyces roridus TaxID=1738132 RepID=A0AAD7CKW7_9AGAR|nr:hypothetical protein FB45DRAFT_1078883 [Roridomyces roridus]
MLVIHLYVITQPRQHLILPHVSPPPAPTGVHGRHCPHTSDLIWIHASVPSRILIARASPATLTLHAQPFVDLPDATRSTCAVRHSFFTTPSCAGDGIRRPVRTPKTINGCVSIHSEWLLAFLTLPLLLAVILAVTARDTFDFEARSSLASPIRLYLTMSAVAESLVHKAIAAARLDAITRNCVLHELLLVSAHSKWLSPILIPLRFFVVMLTAAAREAFTFGARLSLGSLIHLRLTTSAVADFFMALLHPSESRLPATLPQAWCVLSRPAAAYTLTRPALEAMLTLLTQRFVRFFLILWMISNVSTFVFPTQILPRVHRDR